LCKRGYPQSTEGQVDGHGARRRKGIGARLGGAPLATIGRGRDGLPVQVERHVWNIAVEDKYTSPILTSWMASNGRTLITGCLSGLAQTRSSDSYNFLSVGLNFNIGKHAVQPLWWLNPLDYAYNEINTPVI